MTETTFKQLDIGGGPDVLPATSSGYERSLRETRAARLAVRNPNRAYIVFDPTLDTSVTAAVTELIPNVSFMEGKVDAKHVLPFDDSSMDVVEVNHVFYPLIYSRRIAPIEAAIQEQRAQSQNIMQPFPIRETHKQDFEASQQRLADWTTGTARLNLLQNGTATDFADFMAIIREAARVLKSDGQLRIAEKAENIAAITRILDNDTLKAYGLVVLSVAKNDDELRSKYADVAAFSAEIAKDSERAIALSPQVITLQRAPRIAHT